MIATVVQALVGAVELDSAGRAEALMSKLGVVSELLVNGDAK